ADGPGSMLVEDGGSVHAQHVSVGDARNVDTVTISGVDKLGLSSLLSVQGSAPFLEIAGGVGTQVEVKDGGFLRVDPTGFASLGFKLDVAKVMVHGKSGSGPSHWDMSGDVYIGSEIVPSELIVTDGGRVSSTGEMIVGGPSADHDLGRVEVSGSNSFLSANTLLVGVKGHGVLTISGGAQVQSVTGGVGNTQLGPAVGSGIASITGTPLSPSEWRMTGNGFVGTDEPGSVLLNGTTIGPFSAGGATLRVDGTLTVGVYQTVASLVQACRPA
ncbi:MAG: hypothetical protein DMF75_22530, partial [Acidobacteria bacterium]